jgi:hypothetical protein
VIFIPVSLPATVEGRIEVIFIPVSLPLDGGGQGWG